MSEAPAARAGTPAPGSAATDAATTPAAERTPPSTTAIVTWLLRGPRGWQLLALMWAAIFAIQTQVPQRRAPAWLPDGLPRADADLVRALSLDDLGGSVPFWVALALTVVVAVASRTAWRSLVGRDRLALGAAYVGALVLGGALVASSMTSPPTLLDVPLDGSRAVASGAESARLVRMSGPDARCRAEAEALACELDGTRIGLESRHRIATPRGSLRWVGSATAPGAAEGRLELRLEDGARVGFDVASGRPTLVPSLRRRVAVSGTTRSGPLVTVAREGDASLQLAAAILPPQRSGSASLLLRRRSVARLMLTQETATVALIAGVLLLATALLLAGVATNEAGVGRG